MTKQDSIQHVSDTAFWVATYRAMESERPDALFQDPFARILTGDRGEKLTASMKPFESYVYWNLVVRTLLIDELIQKFLKEGYKTIVNLGAGLDTRPYRMDLPSDLLWIEVDFPAVIEMKNEKLAGEKPKCRLERIALDLSDRKERQRVLKQVDQRISPAIILTEGVIPYLTEPMAADLATDLLELSHFGLWIADYYSPKLYRRFQSSKFTRRLGDSPFQFFPKDWFSFFESQGWKSDEIHYLYDEGEKLGRPFPLPWPMSLLKRLVSEEKLAKALRLQAHIVLRKINP
jgi:methyltransferase (TIGR00027 family)